MFKTLLIYLQSSIFITIPRNTVKFRDWLSRYHKIGHLYRLTN